MPDTHARHTCSRWRCLNTLPAVPTVQVKENIARLRESTMTTVSRLNEWNLPGSIDVSENPSELPRSVIDKMQEVVRLGGVAKIESLHQALPSLRQKVTEAIEDSVKMIDQEQEEDEKLRVLWVSPARRACHV